MTQINVAYVADEILICGHRQAGMFTNKHWGGGISTIDPNVLQWTFFGQTNPNVLLALVSQSGE